MNKKKPSIRRWLELIGTLLLAYGVYSERHVLANSLTAIRHAHVNPMLLCFSLTWLLFLWSALGYKILLQKPVRLWHIILAHLAAGGPGRVIPGGAGQLSFGTLFLRKQGFKLPRALALAVSNNLSGFIVNTVVLGMIFTSNPGLISSLHLSYKSLYIAVSIGFVLIAGILLARRSKRVKKSTDNTGKELKRLWRHLMSQPHLILLLILVMLGSIITNSLMLYLAARAVGLALPFTSAVVAMSTGVALGGLVPTPGGIGGVEAGLIASMYALGFNVELATSAALLYRFATYILPFIPGVGAYLYLRGKKLL